MKVDLRRKKDKMDSTWRPHDLQAHIQKRAYQLEPDLKTITRPHIQLVQAKMVHLARSKNQQEKIYEIWRWLYKACCRQNR